MMRAGRYSPPERAVDLTGVRRLLAAATAGDGGVVYLEGGHRSGKSQAVAMAAEAARAAGMNVLDARGRDLEREFPFGVAIQLFEEAWFAVGRRERTALLDGPARWAGELISGSHPIAHDLSGDGGHAVIRGLYWLARTLAAGDPDAVPKRPLALIIDDVERADAPSLRFLAYLAARIGDLPIAVVAAACPIAPSSTPLALGVDPPALGALRATSELVVLSPAGPSLVAVADAGPARPLLTALEAAPTAGTGAVASQMALRRSLTGGHREAVTDLAKVAWDDGALLESHNSAHAWPEVAQALLFVDELERATEIVQAASRVDSSPGSSGAVHRCHGWSLYHQGGITEALAVARAAIAAEPDGLAARGVLAACDLAQGRLDEAEVALSILDDRDSIEVIDGPMLLDVRAQLRLAQMRPTDALADALAAGHRSRGSWGVMGPGVVAWRSTAALAHLALGEKARARTLAEEELELARERGLRRVVMRDLRVLASAAKGTRILELLAEAVKIGRECPPRLEYMTALVDLGAATRRANQRTAARQPLRKGVELAERSGATALARRGVEELEATGARSRLVMRSGIGSLTPSERRVADLAAGGLTTRQIAQVLFVTPKTVEFHLRHIYRKLDVPSSRADLARALSSPAPL